MDISDIVKYHKALVENFKFNRRELEWYKEHILNKRGKIENIAKGAVEDTHKLFVKSFQKELKKIRARILRRPGR